MPFRLPFLIQSQHHPPLGGNTSPASFASLDRQCNTQGSDVPSETDILAKMQTNVLFRIDQDVNKTLPQFSEDQTKLLPPFDLDRESPFTEDERVVGNKEDSTD